MGISNLTWLETKLLASISNPNLPSGLPCFSHWQVSVSFGSLTNYTGTVTIFCHLNGCS